jgi:hypothetical protein
MYLVLNLRVAADNARRDVHEPLLFAKVLLVRITANDVADAIPVLDERDGSGEADESK